MKTKFIIIFLFAFSISFAQSKNIFLDRAFWKSKPNLETVKQKIKEGNDPAELNSYAFDGISYALIEQADNEIVKHLLTFDGNGVNKKTHDGRNYIFWAAYKGNLDMMKYLVSKGSKTDIIDDHGFSVLNFAAYAGQSNTKLYDFLIAKGANPLKERNRNGANPLLLSLPRAKDFTLVDYFTNKGLSINSTDKYDNGALNYLAQSGNRKLIEQLLAKGFSYKGVNKKGENAMLLASRGSRRGYNKLDFFKYLESLGVKPNIKSNEGLTPLHNLSWRNKDIPTLQYFIDKGVDVNQVNDEGNTALLNASRMNSLEVVKLFGEKTKNINHTNNEGHSALTKSLRNTPEVVSYLLKKGALTSVIDKKGNNLVHYLVQSYNPKKESEFTTKLKALEAKGLNTKQIQKDGSTLYHLAVDKNSLPLFKLVKPYNVDINAKNKNGLTALQLAVMKAKNDKLVKYLIAEGAKKDIKTEFDETLYDLAKENEALKNIDISFLKVE